MKAFHNHLQLNNNNQITEFLSKSKILELLNRYIKITKVINNIRIILNNNNNTTRITIRTIKITRTTTISNKIIPIKIRTMTTTITTIMINISNKITRITIMITIISTIKTRNMIRITITINNKMQVNLNQGQPATINSQQVKTINFLNLELQAMLNYHKLINFHKEEQTVISNNNSQFSQQQQFQFNNRRKRSLPLNLMINPTMIMRNQEMISVEQVLICLNKTHRVIDNQQYLNNL